MLSIVYIPIQALDISHFAQMCACDNGSSQLEILSMNKYIGCQLYPKPFDVAIRMCYYFTSIMPGKEESITNSLTSVPTSPPTLLELESIYTGMLLAYYSK